MDPVYLQVETLPSARPELTAAGAPGSPGPPGLPAVPGLPGLPGAGPAVTRVMTPGNSARAETSRLTTTTPRAHVRKSYRSLIKALVKLGYDREEAEEAMVSALRRLHERGEEFTRERLVQLALCPNA